MEIYINNHRLHFVRPKFIQDCTPAAALVVEEPSFKEIQNIFSLLQSGRVYGNVDVYLAAEDKERLKNKFKGLFSLVLAAGGVVKKGDDVLIIERNGKWDLPKGKAEEGESIEETAVREVEEETGAKVELGDFITHTWHTYMLNGIPHLKKTYWYELELTDDSKMAPQVEEGIAALHWVGKTEMKDKIYHNTFQSIVKVLESIG